MVAEPLFEPSEGCNSGFQEGDRQFGLGQVGDAIVPWKHSDAGFALVCSRCNLDYGWPIAAHLVVTGNTLRGLRCLRE